VNYPLGARRPLAALAAFAIGVVATLPPVTAASASGFSDGAMTTIRVLAEDIGIRPAGTAKEREAAQYMAEQYRALGYSVEIDPFNWVGRFSSGTSQNVVARYPNEDPNLPLVILGGHYDTVATGPGANDNASGTATTLEIARVLAADPVPGVAVRFSSLGAEEVGLFGGKRMADTLSAADRARLKVFMSIDMMSVGEQPAFHGSDPWVSHALARAASQGWSPVLMPPNYARMSDHGPFLEQGLPAMFFYWTEDYCWHLACDVADRIQPEAIDLMGAIAIELIKIAAE
jgi:Zn-dependent M28 family amino/carboxypeptidase